MNVTGVDTFNVDIETVKVADIVSLIPEWLPYALIGIVLFCFIMYLIYMWEK